ncbi:hypothetical protein GCM10007352_01960 [Mucilaginibacter phyllosphaerae]|nr:hypothetical protein GCM10007352_01960 [Mucilaginibacter phyllosphaerae]
MHAQPSRINRDTLISIIEQKGRPEQQKRLIRFVKKYVQNIRPGKGRETADTLIKMLAAYNLPDKGALQHFILGICLHKNRDLKNAELHMLQAVEIARKNNSSYLLYQFLSHLGFIQTDAGDFTGAVYSYRLAQKEALQLNDNHLQTLLDVNISDLYYKSGFYNQSINYLNQAQSLLTAESAASRASLSTTILYNKSENYFRMKNYDSLLAYHQRLLDAGNKSYKIQTYRLRTAYYLKLLKQDYVTAIGQIMALKRDKKYVPSELDDQQLAYAYFMNKQLDSAKVVVAKLLKSSNGDNHPEIRFHLYDMLAQIAEKQGDVRLASANYKLALQELKENNLRISKVGNISSQMKIDETENSYLQRAEAYKRERLWLILLVITAALVIITITLIYRAVKQKRHYERLLYLAKKEELAFINSHEVRKYLTNILGIMDILKNSESKMEDYEQIEPYLHKSASLLDKSIRNISEKLNEEDELA